MPGPLSGVRVVELGGIGPGPFGGMMLADLGAEVIRIDRRTDDGSGPSDGHLGDVMGRGKRSIALDLKDGRDLESALALADCADALVDPFRPGVAERLGIGPDSCLERNPRLVYARMTGWGQDGPLAEASGHDLNYIALAGALAPIGYRDRPPPPPLNLIGDYGGGGMLLAYGIVCALFERERSGRGQVLDVAMLDGVAALMAVVCQLQAQGQWSHSRGANWLDGGAPWYRAYRTADDRFLTVAALEPAFYALFLERLGLDPDAWPQWARDRWPAQHARLAVLFASRTLDEWRTELEGTDICFAPAMRVDEAARHPHNVARRTYVEEWGVLQPAPAPRFDRTPGAIHGRPPVPGEHTAEILSELENTAGPTAPSPRSRG